MTRDEVVRRIDERFGATPRPNLFIRGTCSCEECLEHEEEMRAFPPQALPLAKLDNPGWDPICFASNAAFAYFLPGLVRLVLDHTGDYAGQFLFHLEQPERLASFSPPQARALCDVLDFMTLERTAAVAAGLVTDDLFRTREKLQQIIGGA